MSTSTSPDLPAQPLRGPVCPSCGAKRITSAAAPCWLCEQPLPLHYGPMPVEGPSFNLSRASQRTKGDNILLVTLGIGFVCILFWSMTLITELPGLAILLGILALPALLRTLYLSSKQEQLGRPFTGGQWIRLFLGYLGVIMAIGLAGFAAFFCACTAICLVSFH